MGLLSSAMKTELAKKSPAVHPLLELGLPGGTKRYGSVGTASASQGYYQGKILRWGPIVRGVNPSKTQLELVEAEVDLDDNDFEFAKIREGSSGKQVRNSTAKIILASPNVSQADWFTLLDGRLDRADITAPLVWTLGIRPADLPLHRYTPKVAIMYSDWPNCHAAAMGQYAPLIYGEHDSSGITNAGMIPTYYVDTVNYTYLVSLGLIKDITGVYKDGTKLAPSAWSRANITRNGKTFTCIDFTTDQGTAAITADVQGYTPNGDGSGSMIGCPVTQQKHFLVNFVWGNWKTGDWLADSSAPIDTTHFTTAASFASTLGFEGSFRLAGTQRKAIDVLNEWLSSWQMRTFWTNAGKLAILPLDFTSGTTYIDDPWLRGLLDDLGGAFALSQNVRDVIDRVQTQYIRGSVSGQYHQTLEVRDPDLDEEASEALPMPWSAARLV